MTTIDGGIGQAIPPVQYWPSFADALTAQSVGLRSGFTVITTKQTKLSIARLPADAVAAWTLQGDELPLSDPAGDAVETELQKIGDVTALSRESIETSEPSARALAEHSLQRGLSLGLDLGFFEGTGIARQILGLANTPGVQVRSLAGQLADLDPIADAIGALEGPTRRRPTRSSCITPSSTS